MRSLETSEKSERYVANIFLQSGFHQENDFHKPSDPRDGEMLTLLTTLESICSRWRVCRHRRKVRVTSRTFSFKVDFIKRTTSVRVSSNPVRLWSVSVCDLILPDGRCFLPYRRRQSNLCKAVFDYDVQLRDTFVIIFFFWPYARGVAGCARRHKHQDGTKHVTRAWKDWACVHQVTWWWRTHRSRRTSGRWVSAGGYRVRMVVRNDEREWSLNTS